MAQGYFLNRRFRRLYGATGAWGVGGGGLLAIISGQTVFGALLVIAAIVLLILVFSGRIFKERSYTGTDVFFLSIPMLGVILIAGIYYFVFPWLNWILLYLGVFVVLGAWAIAEFRRSTASTVS